MKRCQVSQLQGNDMRCITQAELVKLCLYHSFHFLELPFQIFDSTDGLSHDLKSMRKVLKPISELPPELSESPAPVLSHKTETRRLNRLPIRDAGITVINHSIWPVVALPINPAVAERSTMARLLPMAILVRIWTKEVISGMRINDPP